jgi:hypothetical protein
MLALSTTDNQYFDLEPRTSITLNLINPIFDRESIDRVFTFPFTLPATPNNLALLQHATRLDARHRSKLIPAVLWIEGNPFQYGEIEKIRTSAKFIEVSFKNISIRVMEKLEVVKLQTLTINEQITTRYNPNVVVQSLGPYSPAILYLGIGINDRIFIRPINQLAGLLIDINTVYPGVASFPVEYGFTGNRIRFQNVPDPSNFKIHLRPPVNNPENFAFFDWLASNTAAEATRIESAFDSILADGGTDLTRYPCISAPNIYGNKNEDYVSYANYIQGNTQHHPNDVSTFLPVSGNLRWKHTLVPFPYLERVVESIMNHIDLTGISGSFFSIEEIKMLLLWQNTPIDLIAGQLDLIAERFGTFTEEKYHTYQPIFNIAKFLPDMTAKAFIYALANTFCQFFKVKQGRFIITPIRDLLRSAPEDWTAITEPYQNQVFPSYKNYSLDYDRQGDATRENNQLERVDGGADSEPFVAPMYSFYERQEWDYYILNYLSGTSIPNRSWRIPFVPEEGRSMYFNLTKAPTLRLMFWRGMQPDSRGQDYPMASHGLYNYVGDQVGNYSLDWQGPGGLYETWWQDYIHLLTHGRTITRRVRLSFADLVNLSTWNSIKKTVYDEHGQTTAVVKSVRVKVSQFSIGTADVEFVTL